MSVPREPVQAPVPPVFTPPEGMRAVYSKRLLERYLREERAERDKTRISDPLPEPTLELEPDGKPKDGADKNFVPYKGRVAIVGAGVAGLYAAMMLKVQGVDNVDILEASDRIGGRCFTYKFPEDESCPHNYYDVGAMRIPDIDAMKSTLDLIKKLGLEHKKLPYVLDAGCEPKMHWYKHDEEPNGDLFANQIESIIKRLSGDNFDKAFESLMNGNKDDWSTKTWLMILNDLSYDETVDAEAAETSTGLFDMAFIESLCDYSDFQAAKNKDWYRLEGGMSVLTDEMNKRLEDPNWPCPESPVFKVKTGTPVVAMSDDEKTNKIKVTTTDRQGFNPKTEE